MKSAPLLRDRIGQWRNGSAELNALGISTESVDSAKLSDAKAFKGKQYLLITLGITVGKCPGRTELVDREYKTCLSTTSEFTTGQDGAPDDVFIGSALRYAYGFGKVVSRQGCQVVKDARFAMTPVDMLSSYNHTESYVRDFVIPELQDLIAQLV